MHNSEQTLNAVKNYVLNYLKDKLSPDLTFHNLNHTLEVVAASKQIAGYYNLTHQQSTSIEIAAWFHDCGYVHIYTGHENRSKQIAEDFLKGHQYPEDSITIVLDCIEATRYPQNPMTVEAKILCDADLYHFTRPDYHRYENALRMELELYFNDKYSAREWTRINCKMLEEHEYFTGYGKDVLQKFKAVNLERMQSKYKLQKKLS